MLTNLALFVSNVRTIFLTSIASHHSFFQVLAQDLLLVSKIWLAGDIEVTRTITDLEALRCLEPQLEACHSLGKISFYPIYHISLMSVSITS
jgi:hypothetical protein